jgi:hypothetical protein
MMMANFVDKQTLPDDTSDLGPALASHGGHLYIAWKGSGNDNLNVGVLRPDRQHLADKHTSPETSSHAPALISTGHGLFISWKGSGNDELNIAQVDLFANTAGGFGIEGLSNKFLLHQTSEAGPALAATDGGAILVGWRGSGNENLNIADAGSRGDDVDIPGTSSETSDIGPGLAHLNGGTYLAWKGAGNDNLSALAVLGDPKTLPGIGARIFGDASSHSPALTAHGGRVFMGWKGSGNEDLNVAIIEVDPQSPAGNLIVSGLGGKQIFPDDTTEQAPGLVSHAGELIVAWKGAGNDNLNTAKVPV